MADHGPHSSECAHAHEAECFCSCRGAGHGIAHMPGALKNKFHRPGGDFTISPVASPTGKTHYYVVLDGDGKSPGGASVNHIPDGDKISDKPTIRGHEVPAPIAKHAKKVEVTATSGKGAQKPAEGKKAAKEMVPSPQAQAHLEAQGITPGTTVKKVGSPDDHVLLGVDGDQAKLWNNKTKSVDHAHYKALFKANGGGAPPAAKAADKAPEKAAGAPNAPQPGKGPGPGHTYAEAHLNTEGIGPGDQVEVAGGEDVHPGQHIYMGHTNGAATLHSLYDGKTHFAPVPALRQPDKPWPLAPGEEKLSSELKSAAGTAPEAAATDKAADKAAHEATPSPFTILENSGKSGDKHITLPNGAKGPWGKYGAAGVMIKASGPDGKPRYLLVQRGSATSTDKGKWQLPGGALNELENAHQGAARETHEELGVSPAYLAKLKAHGEHVHEGPNGWKYTSIAASHESQFTPKVDGTETGDAKWFTAEELAKLDADGKLIPALSHGALQKNVMSLYPDHAGENAAQGAEHAAGNAVEAAPNAQLPEHVQKAISHAHAAPGTVPALVRAQAYNKLSKDEFDALPDEHQQAIAEDLQTMADGGGDSGMASSKLAAGIVNKLGLGEDDGEGGPSAPKSGLAHTAGPDAEEPGSAAHSGPSDADIGHAWGHITGQNIHPKSLVKVEGKNGPHVFEGFDENNPTHVKVRPVGAGDDKTVSVPATDVTKPQESGWAATAKGVEVKTGPGKAAEREAKKAAPAEPKTAPAAAKAAEGGVPAEYTKTPAGKLTATGQTLGTHGAQVSTDTNGDKFLVKPTESGKEMIPHAEAAVSELSNKVGLTTPQVTKIGAGTVQPMIDAKPAFPGGFDPKKLSDADVLAIQKHHVLDWLTSQHDAHAGNWLRDKNGRLVEVDKGQALKFLGSDKLNSTYHPNKQEKPPIYNALLKAAGKGDVKLHDPNSGELGDFIDKVQNLPDEDVKKLFRPYANVMAQKGLTSSSDKLLDKIVARKNGLGQAFAALHHNEGITHAAPAKAAEKAPAKAAATVAHEPHPDGNFSVAQDHVSTHGITPGTKVTVKHHSGTFTYNGIDSKVGLANVTHPSGAKSQVPATNLTKAAEAANAGHGLAYASHDKADAAQQHLDKHGITPGSKVHVQGLEDAHTFKGLNPIGQAHVESPTGQQYAVPADHLSKEAEEAAPAAKAAEPKGSHGLTPGDVVKDDEGLSYVYHGDTANGLAKVQSLPAGSLNFTVDHDELKKVPSPAPHEKAAAKKFHDAHTAAAPEKKAGPGEKKAATLEALGEKGIQPGDVVIAKGKVHSHIVTGVSSTGQVHLQNAYTGVKWTNSHENLTKSPKPGKVAQAAAEKWKASEAGKAATAAPAAKAAEPKAVDLTAKHMQDAIAFANGGKPAGIGKTHMGKVNTYDKLSPEEFKSLTPTQKAMVKEHLHSALMSSVLTPQQKDKASSVLHKFTDAVTGKPATPAAPDALSKAGLAPGDIVTAKGKVHSHIVTGVSSTGKVHLQNAYTGAKWTGDAEDLTKSAKPGKVAQAAADKWKASNGLPGGGGGAAPAATAAKAAPAAKAAEPSSSVLKHPAAVQNMLDAAGIEKGDAVASTHVSGTHLYWGPVLSNKSQAYLYEPKTGEVSKVAATSLWKPSYTAPVTQKDKQDAFKAVNAAQEADAASQKAATATSAKLATAAPKVEVVSHTPAYQALQAQKVAKDAERPAMQAKKSIPAEPLKALLDPSHPYTDETLLEQISDSKATPAQKAKLAADLRRFRSLATRTKAVMAYSNNGSPALQADATKYRQFRHEMSLDKKADARKALEKVWPSVKTDEGRAAMLQYLYERERKYGPNPFVNGMATGPQFASDKSAAKWADNNITVPHVNETERAAIGTYTGSGYKTINKSLRSGGTGGSYSSKVPKVSAAIQRSTLPEDTLLMRGEGHDMLHILGGNENDPSTFEALAGKIADDPAFLSTSIGKKPAFGKPVVWALRAPKGTKGLYVSKKPDPLSSVGTSEREVLLDRHTRRIIHAVYPHPDPSVHKVIVEAEVVPHDWVKPADWKPSPTYDAWKNFIHGDEGV